MVKVIIFYRNMDRELWEYRLKSWSINGEQPVEEIAEKWVTEIQAGPVRYDWESESGSHMDVDNALTHLEQIANGFVDEGEAVLYLNHDVRIVRDIAYNIVKWGREAVWWKYSRWEGSLDDD